MAEHNENDNPSEVFNMCTKSAPTSKSTFHEEYDQDGTEQSSKDVDSILQTISSLLLHFLSDAEPNNRS